MKRRYAWVVVVAFFLVVLSSEAARAESIGLNFTGTNRIQSGFIPPDTMGGVGPDHVVELINGRYAVYNAANGASISSSSLDQFWIDAGVTPSGSFAFDPRILYDKASGRWFATSVDNAGKANNFLVAVSNSSDPTSGWTGFKIDSDTSNTEWADFPTMGIDADGLYIAANMFSVVGGGTSTTSVLVLPKADLISGSVANRTLFENINPNGTGFSIQPLVDLDGGGNPSSLLSAYNLGAGFLKTSSLDGPINAPSLNTAGGFIGVSTGFSPVDADQPGGVQDIDTGDTRFSGNAVLVEGNIWAVNAVEENGRSAVRWYRIDEATGTLQEGGVIDDPSLAYYFPSIAVNSSGNIIIGMSGSDANTFASAFAIEGFYDGGATSFDSPFLTKEGAATYLGLDSIGRNRWGDYSATVLDPDDPLTFWTFQEFASAQNVWAIQITQIMVSPSVVPEPASLALMGLGTLGIAALRRRRRHA